MENLDLSNPIVLAAGAALAFFIGRMFFKFDSRVEQRRRDALKVAGKLDGLGLVRIPALLVDYGVGDYSGMASKLRELAEAISDPVQRHAEFGKVVRAILADQMKDGEMRVGLISYFESLKQSTDPSPPEEPAE